MSQNSAAVLEPELIYNERCHIVEKIIKNSYISPVILPLLVSYLDCPAASCCIILDPG